MNEMKSDEIRLGWTGGVFSPLSPLTYVGDRVIFVPHPQAPSRTHSLVHKAAKLLVTYTTKPRGEGDCADVREMR
jgi:hypothetical protein